MRINEKRIKFNITRGVLALFLIISFLCIPFSVTGNPTLPLWTPGSATLPENTLQDPNRYDLHFSSEYVDIVVSDIGLRTGQLNATYVITNSGNNWINQTIAIPGYTGIEMNYSTSIKLDEDSIDWWVDYVNIENYDYPSSYYQCFLMNVTFAPGQSRTISVEFPVLLLSYRRVSNAQPGNLTIQYDVTTGSVWEGSIDHATIVIEIPEKYLNEFTKISPHGAEFKNESQNISIVWTFFDWEPTEDISVSWIPKGWPIEVTVETLDSMYYENMNITFQAHAHYNYSDFSSSYYYYFDFGDGTTSGWVSNSWVTHVYNSSGTYYVKVWVKDSIYQIGADNPGMMVLNVNEAQPPQPSDTYSGISSGVIIIIVLILISVLIVLKARKIKSTEVTRSDKSDMEK